MTEAKLASPLLLDALSFAVEKHGSVSQARKGTPFPYVIHPLRVAWTVLQNGYDDEVVAAATLHDAIEDTDTTAEEIAERFGERVARLVEAVSEADKEAPWRTRKGQTVAKIAEADDDVVAILAADKLDNVRSVRETLAQRGENATWKLFKAGRADWEWYYRSLAEAFLARDPTSDLFRTLETEVDAVFPR